MSSSQQVLVLEAIVKLDAELAKVMGHVDLLATLHGPHTAGGLRVAIDGVLAMMRELRCRVLADVTETAIETAERVLLARSVIALAQLDALRDAETSMLSSERVATRRFAGVQELREHVLDRVGRLNANLLRERRESKRDDAPGDRCSRTALYHVALDNAEFGFAAIGQDHEVVAFLMAGAASTSEPFRSACMLLAKVLDVRPEPSTQRRASTPNRERRCS